ncbi:hypothetical protein GGI25_001149 [Coemansia spiralis]|uniref:Uncharacterized protein n=2 Tax=Coemansia TaxID=4863 RepID=A0A9W8GAL6_9FUNG|nr:hypothetical protein EDC05_000820 [Coemansia umbellata]KAJ2679960.1 hypothetical protein GGI25_001149 [Coemansia spiralis]
MDGPSIRDYIDARKKSGMSWEEFRALKEKGKEDDFSDSAMMAWRKQLDAEREKRLNKEKPTKTETKAATGDTDQIGVIKIAIGENTYPTISIAEAEAEVQTDHLEKEARAMAMIEKAKEMFLEIEPDLVTDDEADHL